jgi:hypothetical protein
MYRMAGNRIVRQAAKWFPSRRSARQIFLAGQIEASA